MLLGTLIVVYARTIKRSCRIVVVLVNATYVT